MRTVTLRAWMIVCAATFTLAGCGSQPSAGSGAGGLPTGAGGGGRVGAGVGGAATGQGGGSGVGGGGGTGATAGACSDLFDPATLQTYEVEISADELAKLTDEFKDIQAVLAGTPRETYHPITLHFGSETVTTAAIRLKGQSSWVDTVRFDVNPKMQFVIAFDQADSKAAFHGVGKIEFDMPRGDWTFLNERMANTWLSEIGILAPCGNSAKLVVNGAYYGLYVTEESRGTRLLNEFFPGNGKGDLFKGGSEASTNKNSANWTKNTQFWNAKDITAVSQIVDLPSSLMEWAAEALLNDSDGYYGGSHNFYIYDEGSPGYVFLPTDLDSTLGWMSVFTKAGYRQHPIFWWESQPYPQPPGQHYLVVMNDPTWRAHYVDAIAAQLARWDVAKLQARLSDWSVQIAAAVDADPHKWATIDNFTSAVSLTREMIAQRPVFLQSFVACEQGQTADDLDNDGVPWCNDCRDDNAAVHPGAPEVCGNLIDDDCNGVVDEGCAGETPSYPGQFPDGGAPGAPDGGTGGTPDGGAGP